MTLKEKFLNIYGIDRHEKAEKAEKICDEFVIVFGEWLGINNPKKLLEIYKKEKGL